MSRQSELAALARVADTSALSNRNLIINGAMQVAQRGTSSTSDGYHTVDRWYHQGNQNDGGTTFSQSNDAPAGFKYSLKGVVDTADASLSSTQYARVIYNLEGNDTAQLAFGSSGAKTCVLSFWAKSSLIGTYGIGIQNSTTDRAFVQDYTIDVANTWEHKKIVIQPDTGGTWNTDNTMSMRVNFGLAMGSSRADAPSTSWYTSGDIRGSANQVNWMATVNNEFYITGVQLEVGDTATEFEHRSYGDELQRCMRYFQKPDATYDYIWSGDVTSGNTYYLRYILPVSMRATPTLTSLTAYSSRFTTPFNFNPQNENVFQITAVCNSTGARGYFEGTYTLDAEL